MTFLRNIFEKGRLNAALLLGLAVLAGILVPFDRAVVLALNPATAGPWDTVLLFVDRWGPRILLILGAVIGGGLWISGRPGRKADGLVLLVGPLLASWVTGTLKSFVARPRPQASLEDGVRVLISLADTRSFPSGHVTTATAFAVALFLAFPRRSVLLLGMVLVPVMMWDRVALAMHYPSDAVAGVIVGALVILGLSRLCRLVEFPVPNGWRGPLVFGITLFVFGMMPDPPMPEDPGTGQPYRALEATTRRDVPRFRLSATSVRVAFEPFVGPPLHAATVVGLRERAVEAVGWAVALCVALTLFPRTVSRRRRLCRALLLLTLLFGWAVGFWSGRLPADRFVAPRDDGIFLDAHVHGSDPVDGAHPVERMLARSRARGVHVTALTNHDAPSPTYDALFGTEWSGRRHPRGVSWHLLFLGGEGAYAATSAERDPLRAVALAKAAGATVIVAHYWTWEAEPGDQAVPPSASPTEPPTLAELAAAGVDGFEVGNRAVPSTPHVAEWIQRLDAFCRERGLLRLAVSDGHGIPAGSSYITFVEGHFSADPVERRRQVLEHLVARREVLPVVFRPSTRLPLGAAWVRAVAVPMEGVAYLRALTWKQRLSWLVWFTIGWWASRARLLSDRSTAQSMKIRA